MPFWGSQLADGCLLFSLGRFLVLICGMSGRTGVFCIYFHSWFNSRVPCDVKCCLSIIICVMLAPPPTGLPRAQGRPRYLADLRSPGIYHGAWHGTYS